MRLKELRKARKYKQTDLAEVLSCSQGVYSRYESGEREPPFDIMKKLADFYGVTIDYLMGGSATTESTTPQPTPPPAQEKAPAEGDEQTIEFNHLWKDMDSKEKAFIISMMKTMKQEAK